MRDERYVAPPREALAARQLVAPRARWRGRAAPLWARGARRKRLQLPRRRRRRAGCAAPRGFMRAVFASASEVTVSQSASTSSMTSHSSNWVSITCCQPRRRCGCLSAALLLAARPQKLRSETWPRRDAKATRELDRELERRLAVHRSRSSRPHRSSFATRSSRRPRARRAEHRHILTGRIATSPCSTRGHRSAGPKPGGLSAAGRRFPRAPTQTGRGAGRELGLPLLHVLIPNDAPDFKAAYVAASVLLLEHGIEVIATGDMDLVGSMPRNWIRAARRLVSTRIAVVAGRARRVPAPLHRRALVVVFSCVSRRGFGQLLAGGSMLRRSKSWRRWRRRRRRTRQAVGLRRAASTTPWCWTACCRTAGPSRVARSSSKDSPAKGRRAVVTLKLGRRLRIRTTILTPSNLLSFEWTSQKSSGDLHTICSRTDCQRVRSSRET